MLWNRLVVLIVLDIDYIEETSRRVIAEVGVLLRQKNNVHVLCVSHPELYIELIKFTVIT